MRVQAVHTLISVHDSDVGHLYQAHKVRVRIVQLLVVGGDEGFERQAASVSFKRSEHKLVWRAYFKERRSAHGPKSELE